MTLRISWLATLAAITLAGCASPPSAPQTPPPRSFIVEEALAGTLTGQGVVTPILGEATSFDVTIAGSWNGTVLTLVEDFSYPTGTRERKTWRLTRTAPGEYVGTREDVIGQARAWQDGTSLRLEYSVLLDTPAGKVQTHFQDVLYWRDDRSIENKATVSKWGLRLARVELQLRRAD
jgi:uncharacterized protein YcfL